MRLLAPFLVVATVVLFASGVAMGVLTGMLWQLPGGYTGRLPFSGSRSSGYTSRLPAARADQQRRRRNRAGSRVGGARARAYLLERQIVSGVVLGIVTCPPSITGSTCGETITTIATQQLRRRLPEQLPIRAQNATTSPSKSWTRQPVVRRHSGGSRPRPRSRWLCRRA